MCSLCHSFSSHSMASVLRHIGAVHAHEPGFHIVCGIDGCPRTYRNYHSYRKHLRGPHHRWSVLSEESTSNDTISSGEVCLEEESVDLAHNCSMQPRSGEQLKRSTALFLLKNKEVYKISQTAINSLVNDVSLIIQHTADTLYSQMCSALQESAIEKSAILGFESIFASKQIREPFHQLQSEYLQRKYFTDVFGLVVSV